MRCYNLWINGKDVPAIGGKAAIRKSPAHGADLASFALGTAGDLNAAVAAAKSAEGAWANSGCIERAALLTKLADLMEAKLDQLAEIEAEEVGKPIKDGYGELSHSINLTRYAAALAWEIPGRAQTHHGTSALGIVSYEPIGVVGMITPWNFPAVTLFQKLPYALAAGCTVVVKPSEMTAGTTLEIARLAKAAGFPDGVINVVTGKGSVVGNAMVEHPDVNMISFTGSTPVGQQIGEKCARQVKRAGLELGGKAANIVFADADLDDALDGVVLGTILNQGEECVAGTRLLVEKSIAEDFSAKLAERMSMLRVGLPLDKESDMGAMIHEDHMNSVLDHIETAKKEGATILCGGGRLTGGDYDKGYFIAPTILGNVTPKMTYFREEVFGPVISITTFETVDEAVALANDTEYGLGNGMWTKDIDKAHQVSKRLKSGTVWVNTFLDGAPQMPFGGYKRSGLGRENGKEGLTEFMQVKSTFFRLGKRSKSLPHTA
ncbi:aldehyde dehydrogenase family protein [Leisingera thetidis]|uniref:aldehyde dehydrogenase family protein n=1 Tax=Leisingera thetidis TaxID=2930199 RepID=UPI0021F7180D|nr:aldehyde dehydrogenase family protein [Leisingera thetidis]